MKRLTIAIAGASGFVGQALVEALAREHDVIAVCRTPLGDMGPHVTFRRCDLFSLLDVERALAGADVAYYLVHSMMPTARLDQGSFEDFDLLCAQNFAAAAASSGVRRIVYLSGLMPGERNLSRHLRSRAEVEETLTHGPVPVTILRAGLVLGAGGSSFRMLVRLVRRLPFMVGPRWTQSRTQPIALDDVVRLLAYCATGDGVERRTFDVACPDVLSYAEMMKRTAALLGTRLRLLTVPFFTPHLSLLWVRVITGTPMALVAPLVESLRHDMLARDAGHLAALAGVTPTPFDAAMRTAIADDAKVAPPQTRAVSPSAKRSAGTVRSVQRLPLPPGWDALAVATEYMRWLPRFFRAAIRVSVAGDRTCRFHVPLVRAPLLELRFAADRSSPARQLFYITGGLLARPSARGRLELRVVPGRQEVLAAIHEYVPTLPWVVYRLSQALVHLLVMRAFGRHLAAQGNQERNGEEPWAAPPKEAKPSAPPL